MEIERKFLVRSLPDGWATCQHSEIEQGYLCSKPTVRVRRVGSRYVLTVKSRQTDTATTAIVNREEEFDMSRESYLALREKCDGSLLVKTRYRIDLRRSELDGMYSGLVAELDIFHGRYEGLHVVEVEFPSTDAANAFVPPSWFGIEVSSDPRYRNSFMALHSPDLSDLI